MRAEEAIWLNESKPWLKHLDSWQRSEIEALATRQPPGGSDHSECAEPA